MTVKCVYLYLLFLQCVYSFIKFNNNCDNNKNIRQTSLRLKINFENSNKKNYNPFGKKYYEEYIKKLNSKNITVQNNYILNQEEEMEKFNTDFIDTINKIASNNYNFTNKNATTKYFPYKKSVFVIRNTDLHMGFDPKLFNQNYNNPHSGEYPEDDYDDDEKFEYDKNGKFIRSKRNEGKPSKSENFEVVSKSPISFMDIGGYDNVKLELSQCIDILTNYKKYSNFNVRVPKGIILEGPPGNGKTLLAKGFAGETKTSFIPVSGSQFQEKYVGVGSSRVRELFELAKKNIPCIVFIDEIDALGRKRSSDAESSTSERDNTLNELLVNLDGFKTSNGIFLMGATNRADLLDPALLRPGRIDKRIYIGAPDSKTREAVLNIHLKGKPYDKSLNINDLVDLTAGLSCAQIENLLNEAMLNALRYNRNVMEYRDIDTVINKIMVGWQPNEHKFSNDIIERIAIHEMGHAIVGFLSKHHSKVSKVIINLSSPNSPGYTMFESATSNIYIREALFEHLMILLAGRIAEEVFYGVSVTTGAINDFGEAFKLAEKMVIYYGMGKNIIYPSSSDKYKELIDDEVVNLINTAYEVSNFIVKNTKDLIYECSEILRNDKILKIDKITEIINNKYPEILNLKIEM